jgi:hypothetical protein
VKGDRYELAVRVPAAYTLAAANFGKDPAAVVAEAQLVRVAFTPAATGEVAWTLSFQQK